MIQDSLEQCQEIWLVSIVGSENSTLKKLELRYGLATDKQLITEMNTSYYPTEICMGGPLMNR